MRDEGRTENLLALMAPEIVQGFSFKLAASHDALRILAIDHLPDFSNRRTWREFFAEPRQAGATPDALHGNRLK